MRKRVDNERWNRGCGLENENCSNLNKQEGWKILENVIAWMWWREYKEAEEFGVAITLLKQQIFELNAYF